MEIEFASDWPALRLQRVVTLEFICMGVAKEGSLLPGCAYNRWHNFVGRSAKLQRRGRG